MAKQETKQELIVPENFILSWKFIKRAFKMEDKAALPALVAMLTVIGCFVYGFCTGTHFFTLMKLGGMKEGGFIMFITPVIMYPVMFIGGYIYSCLIYTVFTENFKNYSKVRIVWGSFVLIPVTAFIFFIGLIPAGLFSMLIAMCLAMIVFFMTLGAAFH